MNREKQFLLQSIWEMKISNSNDNDLQEFQFTSETRKENHIRMVNEKLNEKIPRLVKEMNLQHILWKGSSINERINIKWHANTKSQHSNHNKWAYQHNFNLQLFWTRINIDMKAIISNHFNLFQLDILTNKKFLDQGPRNNLMTFKSYKANLKMNWVINKSVQTHTYNHRWKCFTWGNQTSGVNLKTQTPHFPLRFQSRKITRILHQLHTQYKMISRLLVLQIKLFCVLWLSTIKW